MPADVAPYTQIRCEGYWGGYSRVTDFGRGWRQGEGQSISTTAFVPLAFEIGKAFQFDWTEERAVGGRPLLLHAGVAP